MTQKLISGLIAAALFVLIGFFGGVTYKRMDAAQAKVNILIPDDPLMTEWFIHNNGGIATYATLQHKLKDGTLLFPSDRIDNFEAAETLDPYDAILLYARYPSPHHAIYGLYRSLKHRSAGDTEADDFAGSILQSLKFAEGAMYLAVINDDLQSFEAATNAKDCTMRALAEGRRPDVSGVCVQNLESAFEAMTAAPIGQTQ